jgi:putative transposase
VNLTHKIALDLTCQQTAYCRRAAGTHRFVFNWALAEWNRQYAAGGQPNGRTLKKEFNAVYPVQFPWIAAVHRDCHSQPFADLQKAFHNFFKGLADRPVFKRKNKDRPTFYVANDKFTVTGKTVCLPIIGVVRMREGLRFTGKINSARVVEECGRWFLCVCVDLGEVSKPRTGDGITGVDLGIAALATLSTGEHIENPKPLRKAQNRLRRAHRKLSRRQKGSQNRSKQRRVVAKNHRRIRNIRHDVLHKLTTRLCRENQAVVIEDLNVSGMVKNRRLAQAISDASFGSFRQFLTYKAKLYGNRLVVAGRFYPSSKTCSACGQVKAELLLSARVFSCSCGLRLDRDVNAARNLERLGRATPEGTPVEMPRGVVEAGTKPCPLVDNF